LRLIFTDVLEERKIAFNLALRYSLWVDGKIILRKADGYFTTKKTAKDLQSFLKRTDASPVG
jgi:hypothetical protein